MSIYKNPNRQGSNGSQSEVPRLTIKENKCFVKGYQNFSLTKDSLDIPMRYMKKFMYIRTFLNQHRHTCKTVADIGASNGLISFLAAQKGYTRVFALDHDKECINIMKQIKTHFNFGNLYVVDYSFGNRIQISDIVIACALIHWIYSCTSMYGNFNSIIEYLCKITSKFLLIEWVDPEDGAIKAFKHTSFNKNIITEEYNKTNFLKSLNNHFDNVQKVVSINKTRELYFCSVKCKDTAKPQ